VKQKKRPRRSTVEPKAWWQRVIAGERLPHGMFDAKSKCDAVRCPLPPFHTVTACASTSKRSCHASLAAVARCARVADKLTLRTQKSKRPPSVEALEGSSVIASTIRLLSFERRPPVVHWRSATRAKTTTGPRAHGASKHDELAAAGLSPGEIRGADHNNMRGTHFYCTAPGNVLVEIAKPPKR
jgi:hypothetical protein